MNKAFKRIAAIVIAAMFVCTLFQFNILYAAENKGTPLFEGDGIIVEFYHKGIYDGTKKPPYWSEDEDGTKHLQRIYLFEQSTYADKLPNHYYYRTVGYHMLLVDENFQPLSDIKYYDNTLLRLNEQKVMRELIRNTPGYEFSEPYTVATTISRQNLINVFGEDSDNIDKARYLLRCGEIEFYKSDANGNETPAISTSRTRYIYDDTGTKITRAIASIHPIFRPLTGDFVTRMNIIDLQTGDIKLIEFKPEEPDEKNLSGNLTLSEKRITKAFNLNDIGGVRTFNFRYESAESHYHPDYQDHDNDPTTPDIDVGGSWHDRTSPVDSNYTYVIKHSNTLNNLAIGLNGAFNIKYNGTNVKSGTASWNGGTNSVSPNMFFVAWRGKDKPTLASYKESASNPLVTDLGLPIGKTPQSPRNTAGGYADSISVVLEKSNDGADYYTTFTDGDDSERREHTTGDKATYTATLAVKSFIGAQNSGSATSGNVTSSFTAGGVTFNHAKGYPISSENWIKFYPYVQMAYDTPATAVDGSGVVTRAVNVLAAHESSIKPVDYVEVGWTNPNPANSLTLNSTQWSTHKRAVDKWGKNNVLPGGAIYTLDTKSNVSKVGITTWQHYIPSDQINNVTAGNNYFTQAEAEERDKSLNNQIKSSLESVDVVQFVDRDATKSNAFGGIKLNAAGGQDVYGNKTSNDPKYWLKRGTPVNSHKADEADLDIINESRTLTYYKVNADVNGKIYISKSTNGTTWTTLDTLEKNQTANNITNTEAKALDDRTKLVTNFINALDRNKGNDPTVGNGPAWYNEAWDGICVVKIDTVYDVGFKTPVTRSAVLDPKLTPVKESTSDKFTKWYISQFRLNEKSSIHSGKANGYVGKINGVEIILPNIQNMYVSRPFYIPNATVMDLY